MDEYYASGTFIASGRRVPRTGGVILVNADSINTIEAIIAKDPFAIHGVAHYDIIEFIPSKIQNGFEHLFITSSI